MNKYRTHTCGELTKLHKEKEISLSGWINKKRDHGNLLFIDLRDNSKKNKDWETADIIRDKLSEINIQIKDTREGTNWELNE